MIQSDQQGLVASCIAAKFIRRDPDWWAFLVRNNIQYTVTAEKDLVLGGDIHSLATGCEVKQINIDGAETFFPSDDTRDGKMRQLPIVSPKNRTMLGTAPSTYCPLWKTSPNAAAKRKQLH